jgi:hypothetical protein
LDLPFTGMLGMNFDAWIAHTCSDFLAHLRIAVYAVVDLVLSIYGTKILLYRLAQFSEASPLLLVL